MTNSLIIESLDGDNRIILSEPEGLRNLRGKEYYRVSIEAIGLQASTKVYAYQPREKLSDFFSKICSKKHSWKGIEQWSSLEGEFSIECVWDSTGKIRIDTSLQSGYSETDWQARINVFLTLDRLDQVVIDTGDFFNIGSKS